MRRRDFIVLATTFVVIGFPATADSLTDSIARQLRDQGYRNISISRTFLGRTRIVATSPTSRREIILNPRTGEILRDLWTQTENGASGEGPQIVDRGTGQTQKNDDGYDQSYGRDRSSNGGDDNGGGNSGPGGGDDGDGGNSGPGGGDDSGGDNSGPGSGDDGGGDDGD